MHILRFISQISRAASVMRNSGTKAFLRKGANKARELVGVPTVEHRRYLQQKAAMDDAFDQNKGIDMGGIQRLRDMTIQSENARYGSSHIASDPSEFADDAPMPPCSGN